MSAVQVTAAARTKIPATPALAAARSAATPRRKIDAREDAPWVRWTVIAVAVGFLALFIVLPLICVLTEALRKGMAAYFAALTDADTLAAIRLTLMAAAISVIANVIFGVIASWAIAKFE